MLKIRLSAPGIAKAYLKLGEKRANEIVLDKEGKIEERGGTKIQYEAGKLTYVSLDTITDAIEYDELIVPAERNATWRWKMVLVFGLTRKAN